MIDNKQFNLSYVTKFTCTGKILQCVKAKRMQCHR